MGRKISDLVGKTFGRLLVIKRDETKVSKHSYFICRCSCDNIKSVRGSHLVDGNTQSCGCLQAQAQIKHGMHGTKTYRAWAHMKGRCNNPKDNVYQYYGERGITYDPKWETFEGFFEDMGKCPPRLTIERKDVNGNYCKENCEWADCKVQANNTRSNHFLVYNGKRQTLAQWADETGIPNVTILERIAKYRWSVEKALTTPPIIGSRPRLFVCTGKSQTITQWADELGTSISVIYNRINVLKWPIEKALTTPARKCKP